MIKSNFKKINLVKNLSAKTGYSLSFCNKLIDDLIKILIDNIKSDKFNLKNIGSFKLIKKKERIGRNPKTKEKFIISSRKSVSFKASKKITNDLNFCE